MAKFSWVRNFEAGRRFQSESKANYVKADRILISSEVHYNPSSFLKSLTFVFKTWKDTTSSHWTFHVYYIHFRNSRQNFQRIALSRHSTALMVLHDSFSPAHIASHTFRLLINMLDIVNIHMVRQQFQWRSSVTRKCSNFRYECSRNLSLLCNWASSVH